MTVKAKRCQGRGKCQRMSACLKMEIDGIYLPNSATCVKCRLEGKQYHFNLRQIESDVSKEIVRRLYTGEWKTQIK